MLFLVSTLGVSSDVQTLFRDIAAQVQSNSSYGTIRVHVYNYSYDFFFIYDIFSMLNTDQLLKIFVHRNLLLDKW
jgi:hypothetical protein